MIPFSTLEKARVLAFCLYNKTFSAPVDRKQNHMPLYQASNMVLAIFCNIQSANSICSYSLQIISDTYPTKRWLPKNGHFENLHWMCLREVSGTFHKIFQGS